MPSDLMNCLRVLLFVRVVLGQGCTSPYGDEGGGVEVDTGPKPDLEMRFTADNWAVVYVDGVLTHTSNSWQESTHTAVPAGVDVVAFKVGDTGGVASFLASYDVDGWSTADLDYWRCTTDDMSNVPNWNVKDYDDSSWQVPTVYGANGVAPWGHFDDIDDSAVWIWTTDRENDNLIWCRHNLFQKLEDVASQYAVGDQLSAACTPSKIRVSGDETRTCQANGAWTGQELVCAMSCPSLPPLAAFRSIGCYHDTSTRDLPHESFSSASSMTHELCAQHCLSHGYRYAATQFSKQCYCGDSYGTYGKQCPTNCKLECKGDRSQICGGHWANSVLDLTEGSSYNPTDCTTSGQVEGTVCTASCNAGFYHDGGTAAITCTDTGDWDSTDYMLCGGGCPKLAPIDLASYDSADCMTNPNQARGTVCIATCNPGYYPDGGTLAVTCGSTGEWDTLDCEIMTCLPGCSPLTAFTDGTWNVNCTSSNVARGTVCSPDCKEGYYSSGTTVSTCIQDSILLTSVWDSQDTPLCVPGCSALSAVTDGTWDSADCTSSNVAQGTVCSPVCNAVYYSSGTTAFTCIQDSILLTSVWDSQDTPLCVPGCSAHSAVTHGTWDSADCTSSNVARGTVCSPVCNAVYYSSGTTAFTCIQDSILLTSVWDSQDTPLCVPGCSAHSAVTHGTWGSAGCTSSNVARGTVCSSVCNAVYYSSGTTTFTCIQDSILLTSVWDSQDTPLCVPGCSAHSAVTHGTWDSADCTSSNVARGTVCSPVCSAVYYSSGTTEFTCIQDSILLTSVWDSQDTPLCVPGCSGHSAVTHGTWDAAGCTSSNVARGTVCSPVCNDGHYSSGTTEFTCIQDSIMFTSVWDPKDTPQCTVYHCDALEALTLSSSSGGGLPTQTNVNWHHAHCTTAGRDYGQTCTATCDPGYDLVGTATLTCGIAVWSADVPYCQIKHCSAIEDVTSNVACPDCSTLPMVLNVNFDTPLCRSSGLDYSQACTASCDTGYDVAGASTVTCAASGEWDSDTPYCAIKECPPIPAPVNGTYAPSNCITDNINYMQTCTLTCGRIYKVMPEDTATQRCEESQQWSYEVDGTTLPYNPFCQLNACQPPEEGVNSTLSIPDTPLFVGIYSTYTCITGYEPQFGEIFRHCLLTRQWSGSPLECGKVRCPEPSLPIHVEMVQQNQSLTDQPQQNYKVYYYEDEVEFRCNSSYEWLAGDLVRQCQADGTWSGVELVCRQKLCANPPVVPNSQLSVGGGDFISAITYSCLPGYEQVGGDLVRDCLLTEEWSGVTPTCQEILCTDPPSVTATYHHVDSLEIGAKTHYFCETGYLKVAGDDYITCNITAQWEGQFLQCQERSCPPVSVSGLLNTTYGDALYGKALLSCPEGYRHLEGISAVMCLSGSVWEDNYPVCTEIDCGAPNPMPLREVTFGPTVYNSLAELTCVEGTEGSIGSTGPPYTDISVCQNDEFWSIDDAPCYPITCNVSTIPGGNITYWTSGTAHSDIILQSCHPGYTVVNDVQDTRVCEAGVWSGEEIQCQEITCPALPVPVGTTLSYNNTSGDDVASVYGIVSTVTYTCDLHYRVTDFSAEMTRNCTYTGVWSVETPTCEPTICPDIAAEWPVILTASGFTPGSTINQTCATGYTGYRNNTSDNTTQAYVVHNTSSVGDNSSSSGTQLECTLNGSWNGEIITCGVVVCEEMPEVENGHFHFLDNSTVGNIIIVNRTYLAQAEVICDYGYYNYDGDDMVMCGVDAEWQGDLQRCKAITCDVPLPLPPAYGQVTIHGLTLGSNVTYTCDDMYHVIGNVTRTCLENNTWSGETPSCQRIDCGRPPMIANASWYYSHDYFPEQENAIYKCHPGYEPENSSLIMEKLCVSPGVWTGSNFTCTELAGYSINIKLPQGDNERVLQGMMLEVDFEASHFTVGVITIVILSIITVVLMALDIYISDIRKDIKKLGHCRCLQRRSMEPIETTWAD